MKALITGASSGIGRDMAVYLSKLGYELVIVARSEDKLIKLKNEISTEAEIFVTDLSKKENCYALFEAHKDIDILINNAGFGLYGTFDETNLETELSMIDTNITAVHILTKLYLGEMIKKDSGRILNVASLAGFMAGPFMSTYYATKNYVVALTNAIDKELQKKGSHVKISVLCPGPVKTDFNKKANVRHSKGQLPSKDVAKYAIDCMFKNKVVILPGLVVKLTKLGAKLAPDALLKEVTYHVQKAKG